MTTRLEGLVEDYLAHCRAAGWSPKTIRHANGYPLRAVFLPWCSSHEVTEPEHLTARTPDRFVGDLLEHGGKRGQLSKHTAWTYRQGGEAVPGLAKAEREGADGEVSPPKLPRRLVDTLDRDEVQRLEDSAQTERDALIVRVLADTGVPVGELVRLRVSDLVERDRHQFLKVRGKGDRGRPVPPTPAFYRRLARYAERQRPRDASSDRLFLSRRRSRLSGGYEALIEGGVQHFVRDLGERTGLRKRVHPHVFRHSAATHVLRRGMNPLLVARVLGHTSLAMIQNVYSHLTPVDAHAALDAALKDE